MEVDNEVEKMKDVSKSVLFVLMILITIVGFQSSSTEIQTAYGETSFRIVGAFPEWKSEKIDSIEYSKLTEILYFHIVPNPDGTLDTSFVNFEDLDKIKSKSHGLGKSVLIVIGGWESSDGFPPIAKDPTLRGIFVENVVNFVIKHNLDGIDIDWETTINQEKIDTQDILLSDLADALKPLDKIVTISVLGNQVELKSTSADNVEWVNVMAYNMNNGRGHHSTLDDSIASLHSYEKIGIPKEKLVLGVPFYGRNDKGVEKGYDEIVLECSPQPSDEFCKGFFFNGIESMKQKSEHVMFNEYGGVMIWNIAHDTIDQTSLLNTITEVFPKEELPQRSNPIINEVKKTSKGILIFWTQENQIAETYDILIDGVDTDGTYRTESGPQLVDYGKCFIVQARYLEENFLSKEVCLDLEPAPEFKIKTDPKIPNWVKNIMGWYSDGLTTEHEIISAIKFLIEEDIIKLD